MTFTRRDIAWAILVIILLLVLAPPALFARSEPQTVRLVDFTFSGHDANGVVYEFTWSSPAVASPTPPTSATSAPPGSAAPTVTATPTPEPTPEASATPEVGCWITATENVNIRSGPDKTYPIIATAPKGSQTQALAISPDGLWVQVWWSFVRDGKFVSQYAWSMLQFWEKPGDCGPLSTTPFR